MMVKLTQYSHGAGCGCKLSPAVLSKIVQGSKSDKLFESLIIGNQDKDDAAVVDLGDGTGIISTTDFFMPIVDNPREFGRIAAANAISDIYAMGGTPLMAIAIFGWPVEKLSAEIGAEVIAGGRDCCDEANIPLAGGHSIDSPEPIFGLAVTGRVPLARLKANCTVAEGDQLYLTKPLGVGILTTAEKQGKLKPIHQGIASASMQELNSAGQALANLDIVNAMTDVTGFGLIGHLSEMLNNRFGAEIFASNLPLLDGVQYYQSLGCIPGGTYRNMDACKTKIIGKEKMISEILFDPQTSGGLLVSVANGSSREFEAFAKENEIAVTLIGSVTGSGEIVLT